MVDSVAGMPKVISAVLVAVITAALAAPALAQFETSSLLGTVRDQSGAPVPDAVVTLTNTETGVSQTKPTDAGGSFEFFTVRIGTYVVTAEKPGFSVALADSIQVTVGTRQRVDLTLQIGQLTERVEVTAATTRLETDTSQRGQVISGDQIRSMALNGREYSSLALLSTGVRLSTVGTGGLTPREGSFNVNRLRSTFNNFLIDGVDNNAYGTSNQGCSRGQQLSAEHRRRSTRAERPKDCAELVQSRCRGHSNRSQPAVRECASQQRSRPIHLAGRFGGREAGAAWRLVNRRTAGGILQPPQSSELPCAECEPERGRIWNDYANLRSASGAARR